MLNKMSTLLLLLVLVTLTRIVKSAAVAPPHLAPPHLSTAASAGVKSLGVRIRKLQEERKQLAATNIQAVVRGRAVREEAKQQVKAATKISRNARFFIEALRAAKRPNEVAFARKIVKEFESNQDIADLSADEKAFREDILRGVTSSPEADKLIRFFHQVVKIADKYELQAELLSLIKQNDVAHDSIEFKEKLAKLFLKGVNWNKIETKEEESTPLLVAIEHGNRDTVVGLILNGSDPNKVVNGTTPLCYAIEKKKKKIVTALLMNKADANPKTGPHPLWCALDNNNEDVLSDLIHGGDFNTIKNDRTPLIYCIEHGYTSLARKILYLDEWYPRSKYRLNPNIVLNNTTALLSALRMRNEAIARVLIERGDTNLNLVTNQTTILIYAIENGLNNIVTLLLSTDRINVNLSNGDTTPLLSAIAQHNNGAIHDLTTEGADVNLCINERCPLLFAIDNHNVVAIRSLLNREIPIRCTTDSVTLAIFHAIHEGDVAVLQTILELSDIDDNRYEALLQQMDLNPLVYAVSQGAIDIVRHFVHTLNISIGSDTPVTHNNALMEAVVNNDTEIVQLLLQHGKIHNNVLRGPRPDIPDKRSLVNRVTRESTPLLEAISNGNLDIVRLLIEYGADLSSEGVPFQLQNDDINAQQEEEEEEEEKEEANIVTPMRWAYKNSQWRILYEITKAAMHQNHLSFVV